MANQGFECGVDDIAELYLDQLQRGEVPDRAAIVEAFPELAGDLDQRFRLVDLLFSVRDV